MTDPFASIIENARVSHVLQFSVNPIGGLSIARLECTCGKVFSEVGVACCEAFTGAERDHLWVEGRERALAHVRSKVK